MRGDTQTPVTWPALLPHDHSLLFHRQQWCLPASSRLFWLESDQDMSALANIPKRQETKRPQDKSPMSGACSVLGIAPTPVAGTRCLQKGTDRRRWMLELAPWGIKHKEAQGCTDRVRKGSDNTSWSQTQVCGHPSS